MANRERDITEQIALGLPQKTTTGGETQFDQRLFNQSRGLSTGFGDDESYNVYDKPWRDTGSLGSNIYRPTRGADSEAYGLEVEKMMSTNRFVPDQRFAGADGASRRSGPVEFQSSSAAGEEKDEEDLFGVIGLLSEAKYASKRPLPQDASTDRDDDKRKRREKYRD